MKELLNTILPLIRENQTLQMLGEFDLRVSLRHETARVHLHCPTAVAYAVSEGVTPGAWYAFDNADNRPQRNYSWTIETNNNPVSILVIETHDEAGLTHDECHAQNTQGVVPS